MDVRQATQLTWNFKEDKFPDPLMPPPVGFELRPWILTTGLGALPTKLGRGGHPSNHLLSAMVLNFSDVWDSGLPTLPLGKLGK